MMARLTGGEEIFLLSLHIRLLHQVHMMTFLIRVDVDEPEYLRCVCGYPTQERFVGDHV
jgi:hypothetical protein